MVEIYQLLTGIGFACARELVHLGATVLICARTTAAVEAAVSAINGEASTQNQSQKSGHAIGLTCDVGSSEGRQALVDAVSKHFGARLNILVNNVGTNMRKTIEESTQHEYDTMMRTNVESCFNICKHLSSALRNAISNKMETGGYSGTVVNVASAAGIRSSGTGTIYAMTKGSCDRYV